ncbi:MAG: EamA family transporter [Pseudomonadota bacterium]
MSALVFGALLCAALLHAGWNVLLKARGAGPASTALLTGGAALLAALALPFLAPPAAASWPWIAGSTLLQLLYYRLLGATYGAGEMSHGYPLMRGAAPLLVALASAPLLGEPLGALRWGALACICAGVLLMARGGASRRGTGYALLTACVIAAYTLVDATGVRLSGAPLAYTMWIFMLSGALFCALASRPGALWQAAIASPAGALAGGACALGSYTIALWAMTQAPVATVAALRETAILFGVLLAALVLGERIDTRRALAVLLIACGAALCRLA